MSTYSYSFVKFVKSTNQLTLKVKVFPLALIYNPLVVSLESDAVVISKPNGLLTQLLGGVNIYHQLAIAPLLVDLLHPKKIEEPPIFSTILAFLKPSSQLLAVGFICALPYVLGNSQFIPLYLVGND
ncbi:MAG: hypothetical protein EZS28_047344, partial [Streblomastix strix]